MLNIRTVWNAIALCLLAGILVPAWAMRTIRVYDVAVPNAGPSAFQDAMRIAVIRATGQRDADQDPVLQTLITEARRYAQVVRPVAGGGTHITFDGGAIDRALVAAGKSLWPRDRPVVLLMVEGATDVAATAELAAQVDSLADARGLPIIVQWGTASGASVASRDAALAAARRATADYALLATSAGSGRYELRLWVPEALDARLSASNWSGDLLAGVQGAADALAGSSIGLAVQPELETELGVAGVSSLRDYVDVTRSLTAIAGVKALQLLEIGNGTAIYRLVIRGGDDTLQAALASAAQFNSVARSGSRMNVVFRR
jgi:hypothetical protein